MHISRYHDRENMETSLQAPTPHPLQLYQKLFSKYQLCFAFSIDQIVATRVYILQPVNILSGSLYSISAIDNVADVS